MVYWTRLDDTDDRFNEDYEIVDYFGDDICEETDDRFERWLDNNYSTMELWEKWRGGLDANELWYDCENEVRDEVYNSICYSPDDTFEIYGIDFICMLDDEDDEFAQDSEDEDEDEKEE